MTRGPAVIIGWTAIDGRSRELGASLGAEAFVVYDKRLTRRSLVPLRYALSALATAAYLARRRPRAVIAMNPPIFPAMLALAYGALARVPIVLDSHTGSFGLKGDELSRRLLPLHAWAAKRARATLVTGDHLMARVREWGGRPEVVHEAPPLWTVPSAAPIGDRARVLFACTFDADEAVDEVVEAARRLEGVEFEFTGDVRRLAPDVRRTLPANVRLLGFVREDEYAAAMGRADLVLALTTEPASVMRAAYEAVYACRPLIVSDWPQLRTLFPHAVHTENTAAAVAEAVAAAVAAHDDLRGRAEQARELQCRRWERQRARLRELLELGLEADGRPAKSGDVVTTSSAGTR